MAAETDVLIMDQEEKVLAEMDQEERDRLETGHVVKVQEAMDRVEALIRLHNLAPA